MYIQISELEKDVLREILNIGVSKAADAFAAVSRSGNQVVLTVPDIKIIETELFPKVINEYDQTAVIIRSDIIGDLDGQTLILFYQEHIDRLMQACLPELTGDQANDKQLRSSLLLEIGNILTGAIVTQFCNIFELSMHGSPPEALVVNNEKSLADIISDFPDGKPMMITVKTQFLNLLETVELPLLIIMDLHALSTMLQVMRKHDLYKFDWLKKVN